MGGTSWFKEVRSILRMQCVHKGVLEFVLVYCIKDIRAATIRER